MVLELAVNLLTDHVEFDLVLRLLQRGFGLASRSFAWSLFAGPRLFRSVVALAGGEVGLGLGVSCSSRVGLTVLDADKLGRAGPLASMPYPCVFSLVALAPRPRGRSNVNCALGRAEVDFCPSGVVDQIEDERPSLAPPA